MMKTLYINGSPKKKHSVSDFFIQLQKFFVGGKSEIETLRNKNDHQRILEKLEAVDNVVFSLPLYVDSIPSHVLAFLKEMESFCKQKNLSLRVYVVSNGGFIEGKQNKPLMLVFKNFCARSNLVWAGGIGIGGGVMLNVLRYLLIAFAALFVVNIFLDVMNNTNWVDSLIVFLKQLAEVLFFYLGVLFCMIRMGYAIRKGKVIKPQFTRVMLPSFIFILCADAFFLIESIFKGGIFRGWLSRK